MNQRVDQHRLEVMLANRPDVHDGQIEDVKVQSVQHPNGSDLIVVSPRNAIFMDQQPTRMKFRYGYRERQLTYKGGIWMTDMPQEIWQMDAVVRRAHGNVVIGGLGLGIVSHLVKKINDRVGLVVTVELDQRIIDLVSPYIAHDACDQCDVMEWIDSLIPNTVDFMFLDTWQQTGETVWFEQVVPLRRACRGKVRRENVLCWAEKEMLGQLAQGAYGFVDLPEDLQDFHNPVNVVMRRAAKMKGIRERSYSKQQLRSDPMLQMSLQHQNSQDKRVTDLFDRLINPGTDDWEREFGDLWDRAIEDKNRVQVQHGKH